jgi:hypothetical protein
MFTLLYILVIVAFFGILLLFTFGRGGWGFLSVDSLIANLNNNFLVGLYILLPAILTFLVTIATRHRSFAVRNWWIAIGMAVVRLSLVVFFNRWHQIRKFMYLLVSVASIAIAYGVNRAVIDSTSSYASFSANTVVLIMWFAAVLVAAKMLGEARFGELDEYAGYRRNIVRLYNTYQAKFNAIIQPSYKSNPIKHRLLFSIMIAEDINRPGLIRLVERMLFPFKSIATTGIMQVTAKEYLSNSKSITIAQEMISGSYKQHQKAIKEEYALIRAVAGDYNGDAYPELVADIYFVLKDNQLRSDSRNK